MLQNWYDSALFFLNESQFLRVLDIHNIQTIVILGTCFINFGDFNLYYHLWGCALRMAQALGLDLPPEEMTGQANVEQGQLGRRLWRSLVTNDWLQMPLQASHSGVDFFSAGPNFPDCWNSIEPETDSSIEPFDYLIVLAKLGTTLMRFRAKTSLVHNDSQALSAIVASTDDELATIVSQLPGHLRPRIGVTEDLGEDSHPWLSWQRENLCIVLLYYRLVINRPLCRAQEGSDSSVSDRATAVCLEVPHSILASLKEFDSGDPILHRRLIWYVSPIPQKYCLAERVMTGVSYCRPSAPR